ncbi:MAG TPA: vWA domain-containing protein, partial [Thermoplasmata archaeon]|nr:vWA domain-containing protein [Thermoplasmata archaeon]
MDGIQIKGQAWNADPTLWPHSATITVKGAQYGVSEARVKMRIEGKGDPIKQKVPQQTCLMTDDSGSMAWNDPNNMRVQGMNTYIDQLSAPDEISHGAFSAYLPSNQLSEIRQTLTTGYQAAKGTIGNYVSSGGTPIGNGLWSCNEEIIPKKKTGFVWVIIMLTDGCYNSETQDHTAQVNRMVAEGIKLFDIGLYPDPNSSDKQLCEPDLISWSQQTGGKYYWVRNPADLAQVYIDIANSLTNDVAGKPPKTGSPMLRFKMLNDIEVVPNSFICDSTSCTAPIPSNPAIIIANNRGILMEWNAPVKELRIKQYWQIEFGVRSYKIGKQIKVNDIAQSFVEYDRYDGSPGGSDVFEQLYVDVNPDVPGIGGAGIAEPPSPPPPPPHGGIPQLIPQPQQVPITYIQNLPVLHGVTQVQGIPLQYLLGSAMGMAVADRVKMKSRIKQGVKIAMASM